MVAAAIYGTRPLTTERQYVSSSSVKTTLVESVSAKLQIPRGKAELIINGVFDCMERALRGGDRIEIRGRNGETLRENWHAGPRTYLGLGVHGFPNLFIVTGPGSPSVLSNMILAAEQHVDWIADAINHLDSAGIDTIEPGAEAVDNWLEECSRRASATLFPSANSWYMGANIPGKPRIFMPFIGGFGVYSDICADVAAAGYRGFELNSAVHA